MDNEWAKAFEAANGRKPTFAEFTAHQQELDQASAAASVTATSQAAPSQAAASTAAPQSTVAASQRQVVGYDTQTGAPIYADDSAQPAQPQAPTPQPQVSQSQPQAPQPQAQPQVQPQAQSQGPTQPPVPPTTGGAGSGFDFGAFIKSPKGMITGGVIIALIAFFAVGKLTDCTAAELQSRYSAAMAAKDPAKLLKLFPHSQTKSKFAKDGAKQLIKVNYAASSIMSGENQVVRVTSKNWLLFFKKYQLNITPTTVKLAKSAKQHALYYKGKKVSTNDLKAPLFYGSYTFTTTQSSQFGSVKAKASVAGGERKSTTLSFPKSTNYVTIPGGPNTFKVSYKGKATDITLKAKRQKVGPFSQNVDDPASELTISGTYGNTVTVDKANLSDVTENGGTSLPNSDDDGLMYELPNSAVTYDFKNIKTNVDAFAKQYFKADHSGSWSGFTLVTAGFKDNVELSGDDDSDETDTYKNIDFTQADVQSYLGDDGSIYLYVPFNINYTYKYDDDSDTEETSTYADVTFKVAQDGKLYGASDSY